MKKHHKVVEAVVKLSGTWVAWLAEAGLLWAVTSLDYLKALGIIVLLHVTVRTLVRYALN